MQAALPLMIAAMFAGFGRSSVVDDEVTDVSGHTSIHDWSDRGDRPFVGPEVLDHRTGAGDAHNGKTGKTPVTRHDITIDDFEQSTLF